MKPKIKNWIFAILSMIIGIALLISSAYLIWDYLAHPWVLRFVWIPYIRLVFQGLFGFILLVSGLALLLNHRSYKTLYKLFSCFLIVFGIDILLMGDMMSGYGIEFFSLFRLYSVFYCITGVWILYWLDNEKTIRSIFHDKLIFIFTCIGVLLIVIPDIICISGIIQK